MLADFLFEDHFYSSLTPASDLFWLGSVSLMIPLWRVSRIRSIAFRFCSVSSTLTVRLTSRRRVRACLSFVGVKSGIRIIFLLVLFFLALSYGHFDLFISL